MRPYTSINGLMMVCFAVCDEGGDEDVVTARLYKPERQDGSDLLPNLSMKLLMLPCPGPAMMHARHVRLLREMLRCYGRVAVELRPVEQPLSS